MRLARLVVSGFRAFSSRDEFDLDANAIVMVGANGQGKTSFFDSILWCLTGSVPRLTGTELESGSQVPVVSKYSTSGQAHVELTLRDGDTTVLVSRSTDGQSVDLRVSVDDEEPLAASSAERRVMEMLWPDALATPAPAAAVTRALVRSVYLQQDRLRDFVEADTDAERFDAVSELVGVGRVTELQATLVKARKAWSESLNKTKGNADQLRSRVEQLRTRAESLESGEAPSLSEEEWTRWWDKAQRALGLDLEVGLEESSAADKLEGCLRQLDLTGRETEAALDRARALLDDINETDSQVSVADANADVVRARQVREACAKKLAEIAASLDAARKRRKDQLESLVSSAEQDRRRRALAELALGLLSESCPVCEQQIDRRAVRGRLERLIETDDVETSVPDDEIVDLEKLHAEHLDEMEKADAALRVAETTARNARVEREAVKRELKRVGIDIDSEPNVPDALAELIKTRKATVAALGVLREEGGKLAVRLARRAEQAERRELQRQLGDLNAQLQSLDRDISSRQKASDVANKVSNALENLESTIVESRLEEMAPLLRRIYARMDPHPAFRAVEWAARTYYKKGRVTTTVADAVAQVSSDAPHLVLSSSQVNALALAIFFTLNLSVSLKLTTTLLDDPLQSLDDVNLLGLTDLLRRTKKTRQVLVSTHDERFGSLLARKLRPVDREDRTLVLTFGGWSRSGPEMSVEELSPEDAGLRVVA